MVEVWADLAAKASSQAGYFEISESWTSDTAVDCGGRSMRADEAWRSQRLGILEGILWVVAKSFGTKSLSHGFRTGGGGYLSTVPDLGGGPCWYRVKVRLITLLWSLWGGHWRWSFSCFFFISFETARPHGNGASVLGRDEETLMRDGSSVWDNIKLVRSWYAAVHASFSVSPDSLWKDW